MIVEHLNSTELLLWGTTLHLIIDWLLQNEWMAVNKTQVRHPAGYVHAGLHTAAMLMIFPWAAALAIGVLHFLIDTRKPLEWWRHVVTQTTTGPIALDVHIWRDQTVHVATIAIFALICAPT